jgi:diketogulonate reductase-like aldo/keto reductase
MVSYVHCPLLFAFVGREIDIFGMGPGNHEKFPTKPDGKRDLYPERSHIATYRDMEKLLYADKVKAIGVANYSVRYLEELLSQTSVTPAVNQIENHILLPQQDIVEFCTAHGIHVTAYSPLGSNGSPLMQLPVVQGISQRKGVSTAAVLLSWHGAFTIFFSPSPVSSLLIDSTSFIQFLLDGLC